MSEERTDPGGLTRAEIEVVLQADRERRKNVQPTTITSVALLNFILGQESVARGYVLSGDEQNEMRGEGMNEVCRDLREAFNLPPRDLT